MRTRYTKQYIRSRRHGHSTGFFEPPEEPCLLPRIHEYLPPTTTHHGRQHHCSSFLERVMQFAASSW